MNEISSLVSQLQTGDFRALARAISIVENEQAGHENLLNSLSIRTIPVIGFTGPPGSGKSSLVNALCDFLLNQGKKIGVLAIDPTSPFHFGSLLGDRIRFSQHFNHSDLYFRSLAARGSLGGLSEKTIEITDVMRAAPFDIIFVETVGVGQSELEIAGLADTTVLVLVPESGDEVQTMKAGIMEIADVFVVNKSDRTDADAFAKNLKLLAASSHKTSWLTPVIKTIAIKEEGVEELWNAIEQHGHLNGKNDRKNWLMLEKAWQLISKKRMSDLNREKLMNDLSAEMKNDSFNLYRWTHKWHSSAE